MTLLQDAMPIEQTAFERVTAGLRRICADNGVAIPLAIESGSRAWGFPSPDSDYDCRFIFVRSLDQHLSPWQRRDVIEMPLQDVLDINGWELGKALKLLLKGNAVIIEWLTSPIEYSVDHQFKEEFLSLARSVADRRLIGRHYLHLGERQRRAYFQDEKQIAFKKIFYALRPAAALRWLRLHPNKAIAPMHFPTLMRECEPSAEVAEMVATMLSQKAITRELGVGPLPGCIGEFIDREFEQAKLEFPVERVGVPEKFRTMVGTFFRETLRRLDRTA
jgi:predicted nucleotidyltransferase